VSAMHCCLLEPGRDLPGSCSDHHHCSVSLRPGWELCTAQVQFTAPLSSFFHFCVLLFGTQQYTGVQMYRVQIVMFTCRWGPFQVFSHSSLPWFAQAQTADSRSTWCY
jgi:hypothetical protein